MEEVYNPIDSETRITAYEPVPVYGWGVLFAEPVESAFAEASEELRQDLLYLLLFFISVVSSAVMLLLVMNERRQSRKVADLKDQFLFLAAHELRTPVTAIKWESELLVSGVKGAAPSEAEKAATLKDIRANAEALNDLVNDLLDASRMDYGTFKVTLAEEDLNSCVAEAIDRIKAGATAAGVELRLKLPDRKIAALTDCGKVDEVVTNLVSNAIKYNRRGGHVVVSLDECAEGISVSVTDDGFGLSAADISKLFQRFSRIETAETKDIQGTGLGLFIVRKLAELLGGDIVATSPGRGSGSTFTLRLPASRKL